MMSYLETVDYLYRAAPLYQMKGAGAYKPGLETTMALDRHYRHPHLSYPTVHVAGTNGKGSTAHTLAAILQASGLRTGLYTSPHLVDFRERIRVNGEMIAREDVVRFVEDGRSFFEPLHPSFFELATAMAFWYFRKENVDVAVIEVGLGGRLDCTNIITPLLSVITNISLDHVQLLGGTLEAIAGEKAGIIKRDVPVLIGETQSPSISQVFLDRARSTGAGMVHFADQETLEIQDVDFELKGCYQEKNLRTILASVHLLQKAGLTIPEAAVREGLCHVAEMTGLRGRWQVLRNSPLVITDAGHNTGGIRYVTRQLQEMRQGRTLRMVLGMVSDKDITGVLDLLPRDAVYYFTRASVERALPEGTLTDMARTRGLSGSAYASVGEAVQKALQDAAKDDILFIGGSCFIVADALLLDWK